MMDGLAKSKLITMRDFLLEVLVVGYKNDTGINYNLTKAVLLDRARRNGFIVHNNPIQLSDDGHAFLEQTRDLT